MHRTTLLQFLVAGALVLGLLVVPFGLDLWSQGSNDGDGGIRLAAPEFVKSAQAQEVSSAAIETVLGEAGFSAYFRKDAGINLDDVAGLYRTVEDINDTYIIGSIDVDGYNEREAPHVYVSTDGWVLAYYRALTADTQEVPVGKSIDILNYNGVEFNTKLKIALNKVAAAVSVPQSFTPTYYHFQYPNATHLTIIGEDAASNNTSFEARTPGTYTYHNISWVYIENSFCSCNLFINGSQLADSNTNYGYLNLGEERVYNVSLDTAKVGLVLLYSKE